MDTISSKIWNTYVCLDHGAGTYFPSRKTKILDARAREAMMIGFYFAEKGYKLWDPKMKNVIISRSVKFDEGNISVHVDIEEHKTDGIDEVLTGNSRN